ncbi:MAG: hypothetical protein ACRDSR_05175 [Pseudonocardiaceae bacterium]
MKNYDQVLWERELAEHMSQHTDLRHLPPPVVPRRLSIRYLFVLLALILVTVFLSALAGWWIGWYLI